MEIFNIFIVVMVMWLYAFVKHVEMFTTVSVFYCMHKPAVNKV